jgi:hypothetical protein
MEIGSVLGEKDGQTDGRTDRRTDGQTQTDRQSEMLPVSPVTPLRRLLFVSDGISHMCT